MRFRRSEVEPLASARLFVSRDRELESQQTERATSSPNKMRPGSALAPHPASPSRPQVLNARRPCGCRPKTDHFPEPSYNPTKDKGTTKGSRKLGFQRACAPHTKK